MILTLAICSLLYFPASLSQPVALSAPEQIKLDLDQNEPYSERLDIVSAGELGEENNEDIDILIDKVREVTTRYKKDVDGTIAEVQQILEEDYSLPRLTRGEIVEILDNLTRADIEELRQEGIKSRNGYQKALMLVMPYTSKDTKLSVEELYTKPPITHIVGSHIIKLTTPKRNIEIITTAQTEPSTSTTIEITTQSTTEIVEPSSTIAVEISKLEESTLRTTQEQLRISKRPTRLRTTKPVELKPIEVEITTTKPKKQTHIYKSSPYKPDYVISTHRPIYAKPTRHYNHKYSEPQPFQSHKGISIISAPTLVPKQPDKTWVQNQQLYKKPTNNRLAPIQSSVYKAPLTSTVRTRYRTTVQTSTAKVPHLNIELPDDMRDFVKDIQLADPSTQVKTKYSSQYVADETEFHQPTTENIDDILSSIGNKPPSKIPDLAGVADTLSPDMKQLLMSFGLIEDPNQPKESEIIPEQQPQEPEKIDIKPVSYTQFKPLPDSAPNRDDMFDFLSSYGLIGSSRNAKKIKEYEPPKQLSEVPEIDMEMIPESMHSVLEDIGLTQSRRGKRIENRDVSKVLDKTHVFNPADYNVNSDELKRLNQLMETLVRLEKLNRTVTEADFQEVDLDNIAEITKILGSGQNPDKIVPVSLQTGPNPIFDDFGLDKNEVKRQELTTQKIEASTSTTTEEPRNPSVEALAESFGAPVTTKAEDATLPPPRKTGFYYLVDWNTFLEVGEEGKNRVNIRFSPRAGDPSRFIKVTVP